MYKEEEVSQTLVLLQMQVNNTGEVIDRNGEFVADIFVKPRQRNILSTLLL